MGLGAMGAMYASRLAEVQTTTLKIIAGTERINKYESNPVTVNGKPYFFDFITPGEERVPADLIIVAVKYPDLEQAISDLSGFVGKETIILSLLNGISSEEIIGAQVGMEHLLYAFGLAMVSVREGTSVRYTSMGKIVFGEKENLTLSPRVLAVKDLFDRARIPYRIPEDMIHAMWSKFLINVGSNQASAILKAPHGVFQKNGEARELMIMAAKEVVTLSQKCGINLTEESVSEFLSILDALDPKGKTSMLQDIEAGRKTEVEIFAGTIVNLGKKLGVKTPLNEIFYKIIRAMEQR